MAKNFFMLFSSGAVLRAKLAKLTAHFGATLYPYPEEPSARVPKSRIFEIVGCKAAGVK